MRSILTVALWLAWASVALPSFAEDAAPEPEPAVDPAAVALVRSALEPIQRAQALDVDFRTLYDVVQEQGHKLQFGSRDTLRMRRPDRARFLTTRDDGRRRDVRYDGETLTVLDLGEKVYGQFPVPDTLDAMFDYLEVDIGMPMPLADLFYSDPSHLSGVALAGDIVGSSRVGDWDCHHLAFRGEFVDWQLWIEKGDRPLLRKFVINHHELPGEPQFGAVFDRWDLAAKTEDADFAFTPPDGAERIPVLAQPMTRRSAR